MKDLYVFQKHRYTHYPDEKELFLGQMHEFNQAYTCETLVKQLCHCQLGTKIHQSKDLFSEERDHIHYFSEEFFAKKAIKKYDIFKIIDIYQNN